MAKKLKLKDPMLVILAILLVFLTVGTFIQGIQPKTIVVELDAAYGGDETGYQGIINEADYTQEVVSRLASLLKKDSHFQVLLTNEDNQTSSMKERCEKINQDIPDVVISIHATGTPDSTRNGMDVYADIPSSSTHDISLGLAKSITTSFTVDEWIPALEYLYYKPYDDDSYQVQLVSYEDTTDYELETWEMMEKCDVPVVVVNQIYVTNQNDIDTWANEDGYTKAANLYYEAIRSYYGIE